MAINIAPDNIERLLDLLGGVKHVAHELDLTTQAVHNWIERGIPSGRVVDILRLIARFNARGGQQIAWRPIGWDYRFKISYDCAA